MESTNFHILGGGPAGLTTGYYAKKHGFSNFSIFEAGEHAGGNCRTLKINGVDCGYSVLSKDGFRFDTGAHRFHDKDPQVTEEVKTLLGDDLLRVSAPSEIFFKNKFYRFPLLLSDLVQKLETKTLLKIAWEKLYNSPKKPAENFATFARKQYGQTLAERFLLNYSEKLWGQPPHKLSTAIAGNRLKGLDLWSFLRSTLLGTPQNPTHLDGSFFYPKYGIGMISDKLCECIGPDHIKLKHRVNRLLHKNGRIERIIVNKESDTPLASAVQSEIEIPVSTVINTLPLTLSMKMLDPPPPPELCEVANTIKYRHLLLCVFCLNRDAFSSNASIYFPSHEFPFTRLYEPKNRSPHMAPKGQTVIVLELPCYNDDGVWNMPEALLQTEVWEALSRVKPIREEEIIHYQSYKLPFAYPVLEVGFEESVARLVAYFETFENLYLTGRSSLFRYLHLHDLFKAGREVIERIAEA
ncbi:FAD-dependent oxidoreductase [Candidatus Poribacteria bacterium]|nr:FAD-dependent oxidoreductase [Candidatus Poribacteria bacterium]